jgi:hypothetical protein
MTTLTEQSVQVADLAGRVRGARVLRDQSAAWVGFDSRVKDLVQRLSDPMEFLEWVQGRGGVRDQGSPAGLSAASRAVEMLLTGLSTEPTPDNTMVQLGKAEEAVNNVISKLVESAETAWRGYTATIQWTNPHIYAPFQGDPAFGEAVKELSEADTKLQRLRTETYLRDEAKRTSFDELLEEQAELVNRLPAMDDEEVMRFLDNAAAQSGAPLTALTDNVRAWLKTHRMSSKYSIRRS